METELIERWTKAVKEVERLKRELNKAECEEANSMNALGKGSLPKDARVGENFCIWVGDRFLEVFMIGQNSYEAKWRK